MELGTRGFRRVEKVNRMSVGWPLNTKGSSLTKVVYFSIKFLPFQPTLEAPSSALKCSRDD